MTDVTAATELDQDALLKAARERAGLDDFGDTWFFEPMRHYLAAVRDEAKLSPAGIAARREVIVKGLVSRLRLVEDIKRHPEILNEDVRVAGIMLGLPRTGSTIFHRLLASAPGMTAIRWWECQNYAPFPGETRGEPVERRAYAQAMLDGWLSIAPDLMSIHPLDIDGPDEEIIILGQLFVSTMLEGTEYIPGFAKWLDSYDQTKGHEDLKVILQYLQWQDPSRRGRQWVLKSPSNLPFVEVAAKAFPEALLIMTHRDPVQTVPSYISMMDALYSMGSDQVDKKAVGHFWLHRLAEWMRAFEKGRVNLDSSRFVDIHYSEVIKQPLQQAERALTRMGITVTPEMESVMAEFLAGNKREQRASHQYSIEEYGLTEQDIEREFADYRARYIG